ncbi:MAG: ROK family protein [Candidatus Hydrogenedentes bacterium]|nr:ROK family protein [Candidatus Hydrogenedentota bacterium]
MKKLPYTLGLDVGGSVVKCLALSPTGGELFRQRAPHCGAAHAPPGHSGAAGFLDAARNCAAECVHTLEAPPAWTGVAAPGLAARDGRSIAVMPGRMAGLEGLDWGRELAAPGYAPVLNDGHAALLGEAWLGAGRGCQNLIMFTLGTGVGGALLLNGRIFTGALGRAGHLGHICLNPDGAPGITRIPGSLEDQVGEFSLFSRSEGRFETTAALLEAVYNGDAFAQSVWQRSIRALACGIASLINVADPEGVIVGGGIAQAGSALLEPLEQEMNAVEWRPVNTGVPIKLAELGEWAGAIGAARHAMLTAKPEEEIRTA